MGEVAWKRAKEREAPCWSWDQMEAALEAVAWTLQTQGEKTRAELAGPIERSMAKVGECTEPVEYLQEKLGLLAAYGERHGQTLIAFRHLTFQEYFVARRLHRAWYAGPAARLAFSASPAAPPCLARADPAAGRHVRPRKGPPSWSVDLEEGAQSLRARAASRSCCWQPASLRMARKSEHVQKTS